MSNSLFSLLFRQWKNYKILITGWDSSFVGMTKKGSMTKLCGIIKKKNALFKPRMI